jgi:predicted amidohydrolase
MKPELSIVLIQMNIFWKDISKNINQITKRLEQINKKVDIILLPEMFSTGFTMVPENVYEKMKGETIKWMKEIAIKYDSGIGGSLLIKEKSKFYNRFLFVTPSGRVEFYDKRHTFTFVGEDKKYMSGKNKGIIKFRGWKICFRICYDLRFPVWSRNKYNYDLLIYVANWPSPRINAWDKLLSARAIENCCYCVGVNCIGEDPNKNIYPGHSSTYDYYGNLISVKLSDKAENINVTIDHQSLLKYRKKFGFLKDQDTFELY